MTDWPNLHDAYAVTGAAGAIGRLMLHARQVQRGVRRPWSWALLLDLPIAFGMGWFAYGVADSLHMTLQATVSAAIGAGYLGPFAFDRIFDRAVRAYFGPACNDQGDDS